jgi:hypothetical protein
MTTELQFILGITLFFILGVFSIAKDKEIKLAEQKQHEQELKKKSAPVTKSSTKTQGAEIIDTLDWMLANNIIDTKEYTRLMGKCLQYM